MQSLEQNLGMAQSSVKQLLLPSASRNEIWLHGTSYLVLNVNETATCTRTGTSITNSWLCTSSDWICPFYKRLQLHALPLPDWCKNACQPLSLSYFLPSLATICTHLQETLHEGVISMQNIWSRTPVPCSVSHFLWPIAEVGSTLRKSKLQARSSC